DTKYQFPTDAEDMSVITCRVQYLDDADPFACTNFAEPRRPPPYTFYEHVPLSEQIAGVHKLLDAPLKLEECTLQLSPGGNYLDLESSLAEQRDDLELFYEDVAQGKKPILILRTQLSVRVHSILEKLYNSNGPELRRSLFSLKQLFQDDKDLVPEFVNSEGLTCFIKVGAEADQNYQNYILRALSQIMLFVDGMNGVIQHNETLQWLYTLCGSLSRLVVKTALKLLIVFVEYIDSNSPLLIQAVGTVDSKRGVKPWTYLMDILEEKNCSDSELLVYTVSLINKTLAALPDQDSFYDVTDCLEELGMERIMQKHMSSKGTEADLKQQLAIYENALRFEDGEVEEPHPNTRRERRKGALNAEEGRRSRRSSFNNLVDGSVTLAVPPPSSPRSPELHASTTLPPDSHQCTRLNLYCNVCVCPSADHLRQTPSLWKSRRHCRTLSHRWRAEVLSGDPQKAELESLGGRAKAAKARLAEEQQGRAVRPQCSIDAEMHSHNLETTLMMPLSRDSKGAWDRLQPTSRALKIKDLDFSDLLEEEDIDVLDADSFDARVPNGIPPPPPTLAVLGLGSPAVSKKKKTVKLFWKELKQSDSPRKSKFGRGTVWASLDKVAVDSAKLEHLFESRAKELPVKKSEILVLDPKRSNAINIGMTVLPSINIIKNAILTFDEFAITKEGIEKILTMMPSDEEKQRIQEAQLANPDVPLGSAEKFLFTLSSISALSARLQLWAFRLNYETLEKEVAEPLFDLKLGMEQLAMNTTFKRILATLLAIGNFLNGSNVSGFELSYLDKVTEVKDTVHRQSLLYHTCHVVVEKYPETSDMYSEIPAITRSAKVDFEQLSDNLVQLERKCKSSWDNLKVMAKHEAKAELKNKMTEFLKDCTERIIILKVVHRRIINRFHSFLLYLGQPSYSVRDIKVTQFCKIISEFSLEYRTTRERVLTQKRKRAAHRERTKTRGKMITETEKFSAAVSPPPESSPAPVWMTADLEPSQEEHENMKNLLTARVDQGIMRRSRAVRSTMIMSAKEDSPGSQDDATDEIMDRLVKSVTQNPTQRPSSPKTRKRSRLNRKSCKGIIGPLTIIDLYFSCLVCIFSLGKGTAVQRVA
uniref:Formin homology 2 domain containing 1 n=1 Tax=Scleropages formosus TaxID=113540 RepID=A0A8C9W4F0_SCLFO